MRVRGMRGGPMKPSRRCFPLLLERKGNPLMFEERIARGIALLDKYRPEWRSLISLERLDMYSVEDCVLGQVYGNFGIGLDALKAQQLRDLLPVSAYAFALCDDDLYALNTASFV